VVSTGANALIDLKGIRGVKGKLVLVKECQRDPVSRQILHCDFCAVDPKRRINVSVPLHFVGKPPGVEEGGVLEPLFRELEVACLPLAIPESIDVNVEALNIGDSVYVRELDLPADVELQVDAELPVVHVAAPRLEVVEAAEEAPEEAAEGEAEGEAEAKPGKTEASEAGE
jgi:large subunit ribosomal protein L25